jgi:hypothetical protein
VIHVLKVIMDIPMNLAILVLVPKPIKTLLAVVTCQSQAWLATARKATQGNFVTDALKDISVIHSIAAGFVKVVTATLKELFQMSAMNSQVNATANQE